MDTNHVLALVALGVFAAFIVWRVVKAKRDRASGGGSGGGNSKLGDLKKK